MKRRKKKVATNIPRVNFAMLENPAPILMILQCIKLLKLPYCISYRTTRGTSLSATGNKLNYSSTHKSSTPFEPRHNKVPFKIRLLCCFFFNVKNSSMSSPTEMLSYTLNNYSGNSLVLVSNRKSKSPNLVLQVEEERRNQMGL